MSRTVMPVIGRGVEPDHELVHPVPAPLALAHGLRGEGGVAVSGHVQVDVPGLGGRPLRGAAITGVPRRVPGQIPGLVTQMLDELLGQRPLQHRLGHRLEQPALPEQLHALSAGPLHQLPGQRLIHQPRLAYITASPTHLLSIQHVAHRVVLSEPPSRLRLRSRPYTGNLTGPPLTPCSERASTTDPPLRLTSGCCSRRTSTPSPSPTCSTEATTTPGPGPPGPSPPSTSRCGRSPSVPSSCSRPGPSAGSPAAPTAAGCSWDTSKNHSRRWCSMNSCGARMKMRRYRAARRT